ncbi:MAG TPA: S8 family serine peptidase [Chthoniobacterales bacterium]
MTKLYARVRRDFLRLFVALLLCASGGALAVIGFVPAVRATSNNASKIAPLVIEQTADGGVAEFLIVLNQQADLAGADALKTKQAKGRYVRDTLWNAAQQTQAAVLAELRARGLEHRAYYIVNVIWAKGSLEDASAIAARPDVARVEANPVIQNLLAPIAPEAAPAQSERAIAAIEPGISYSRAPELWASGFTGQGIVVGGADTGYRWTHAALKNKYRGWNGATADHDYNWHDSIHSGGGACGANSLQPCDDNGHGSHTIGTAVGDDGSGNQIGMAPGAKWIGCRNMDQGNGTPATYLECLEFFLAPYPVGGTPAQGDPDKAPDVTSNSWDCPASEGCSPTTLQQAFEAQRAAGIMTVASAGNRGPGCTTLSEAPSIYESVYTIGALQTGSDAIAGFSSRGPVASDGSQRRKPDLSAPGTDTRSVSAASDTGYGMLSGTSMAVPHVSGAVALLLSARPALLGDVGSIRMSLNQSAVHLSAITCDPEGAAAWPNNTFGYGRLDAKSAVDLVLSLTGAVSRKEHAGLPFDVTLIGAERGIEPRNSGGNHTLVFTFTGNVTGGNAIVASGTGALAGAPVFSANSMTVNLTGVANAQTLTIELTDVTDGTRFLPPTTIALGLLVGDTSGDGGVNSGDAGQTRSRSGQLATEATFRSDVNVDGAVNSGDAAIVRSRSGTAIP